MAFFDISSGGREPSRREFRWAGHWRRGFRQKRGPVKKIEDLREARADLESTDRWVILV
jgi:hypothetical protein